MVDLPVEDVVQERAGPFVSRSEDDLVDAFKRCSILEVNLTTEDTIIETSELSERFNLSYKLRARGETAERASLERMELVPFIGLTQRVSNHDTRKVVDISYLVASIYLLGVRCYISCDLRARSTNTDNQNRLLK